jgi:Fe-S cluster assembly ATPase SufC
LPVSVVFNEQLEVAINVYGNQSNDINYNSFSAGERKRIDISVLLSFIDITKLITNWSCNLQIWDEVLDAGVDTDGLEKLIKNMKNYVDERNDMGVYVVSHKLQEVGCFDNVVEIQKKDGFSIIKEC